ncbi:hypothetical protein DSO57_1036972 [Entomophthora muscae]|uniref:Uncharacterized protein n=1 Tax=Entomophthora muscae TaxID=34485 RepID=A0ACC2RDY9_9FUNG|nr:hypothetical protein DSO57_1036972 [Entomophthora muscae]
MSWKHVGDLESYVPWAGMHWGYKMPYFLLYQNTVMTSMIVSGIYWTLLAKKEMPTLTRTEKYLSIAMHAFNIFMTFSELILSRNPFVLSHVLFYLPITLLYIPYALLLNKM